MRRQFLSMWMPLILVLFGSYAAGAETPEPLTLGILVSGEVAEVTVREGERVEKGQLLLRLEDALFRARIAEAEAGLRAAQAALRQADDELKRAQELYERTLLADYELREAQLARLKARAEQAAAGRRLLEAETDLRYARLLAPVSGRVGKVFIHVGQTVQNSLQMQPLLELHKEPIDKP